MNSATANSSWQRIQVAPLFGVMCTQRQPMEYIITIDRVLNTLILTKEHECVDLILASWIIINYANIITTSVCIMYVLSNEQPSTACLLLIEVVSSLLE